MHQNSQAFDEGSEAQGSRGLVTRVLKTLQLMTPDEWTLRDLSLICGNPERLRRVLAIGATLDVMASRFWGCNGSFGSQGSVEAEALAFVREHRKLWEYSKFDEDQWTKALVLWPVRPQ